MNGTLEVTRQILGINNDAFQDCVKRFDARFTEADIATKIDAAKGGTSVLVEAIECGCCEAE